MTVLTARSESWSTAVVLHTDVVVVRADQHVLVRARGIEPGMIAMTLRAGVFDICHIVVPAARSPADPPHPSSVDRPACRTDVAAPAREIAAPARAVAAGVSCIPVRVLKIPFTLLRGAESSATRRMPAAPTVAAPRNRAPAAPPRPPRPAPGDAIGSGGGFYSCGSSGAEFVGNGVTTRDSRAAAAPGRRAG